MVLLWSSGPRSKPRWSAVRACLATRTGGCDRLILRIESCLNELSFNEINICRRRMQKPRKSKRESSTMLKGSYHYPYWMVADNLDMKVAASRGAAVAFDV